MIKILTLAFLLAFSPVLAYEEIVLPINQSDVESVWASALADTLCGEEEVPVTFGRVDVLTCGYAIEVDRFAKYHEGIGQAIHYRVETGKKACLALMIDKNPFNTEKAAYIDTMLCRPLDIKLIIMYASD